MEFATNDCEDSTSIEDRAMRASAVLSMASNAKEIDMGPTDARRLLRGAATTALIGFSSALASYLGCLIDALSKKI
jgi:hypothetical protein